MKWLKEIIQNSVHEALNNHETDNYGLHELTKQKLSMVSFDTEELYDMEKKEREELLKSAHEIIKQPAMAYVIKHLIIEQTKLTMSNAVKQEHLHAGRALIEGVDLVRNTLEEMADQFRALGEEDNFDNKSIV